MFKECMKKFTDSRDYAISTTLMFVVVACGILSVFLVAKVVTEARSWTVDQYAVNSISIQGEGEVVAVPDIAMFSFSVNSTSESVESAQEQSATAMNSALAYLKEKGVEDKDVKTTNYQVYPKYNQPVCENDSRGNYSCQESVIVGYDVSQSIEVKVRDTKKAGEILTGIGSRGVNNVSGLQFTIDDESSLKEEARSKAIMDAREKAQTLAKDLGVKLKRVTSFYEDSAPCAYGGCYGEMGAGYGGDMMQKATVAPNTPIGENTIISRVTINYEIR